MRRLKLTLEYDGSNFFGWQLQAKTQQRTVQGVLEAAFASLPGEHSRIQAAGRTDAGVHATGMVAHIDTSSTLNVITLARALNARLPDDLQVLAICEAAPDFEAQYSCRYRYYRYRMRYLRESAAGLVFEPKRYLALYRPLELARASEAASRFEGTHDFAALATQETRTTVRTVFLCRLLAQGRDITLHIAADGFLRGMVRAIVGTLLEVAEGKRSSATIPTLLASRDRRQAGRSAPAHGLYFVEAGYEPFNETVRQRLLEAAFDPLY